MTTPSALCAAPPATEDLIARYDRPVPRYTSYPTAPHFTSQVDGRAYREWLRKLPSRGAVSIYLHVPFCAELCLYCGCTTAVARKYAPLAAYAERIMGEIRRVTDLIPARLKISHLHWGGGTPTLMSGEDFQAIMEQIRGRFDVQEDAELAIEVDPRVLRADMMAALAVARITRASVGVQDFDPQVQEAIGRKQSFEQTERAVRALRAAGVSSLNLDLIYGLPYQTEDSVLRTVRTALALAPDRIAVFGYAHVPWMKRHQALIPTHALPGPQARHAQSTAIADLLRAEGYVAIGLDHFARPDDAMAKSAAEGRLRRNFQGYTTDEAPTLLGFGPSAIGVLPQGYVQNHASTPAWHAALEAGELPIARGIALTAEDRLRRDVIERLMCDGSVDLQAALLRHGFPSETFAAALEQLRPLERDGLVQREDWQLSIPASARIFTRTVAATFDAHLPRQENAAGPRRHAAAV